MQSNYPASNSPTAATRRPGRLVAALSVVLRGLPTLLVLAVLAAAGYWGHRSGWSAPSFSTLFGASAEAPAEDWCVEHNVPESRCIKCNPTLMGESSADWCREHGLPESRCVACHPEILTKGVVGDWCKEHGVPESNCTLCHPEIAVKGDLPPADVTTTLTNEPSPPELHDGHAHGDAATDSHAGHADDDSHAGHDHAKKPETCQTHALRVQFASADAVRKAGLRFEKVGPRPMAQTIAANGETSYDRTHLAHVSARVGGVAWRVEKEIGDSVKAGDVLALIDAAEVGKAKSELLQAAAQLDARRKALERVEQLLPQKISTEADQLEAQTALREAEIRLFNARQALTNLALLPPRDVASTPDQAGLRFLGLPDAIRESLDPDTTTANLVPVLAPLDGVVIARDIVAGEAVEASKPLFTIADTRRMWILLDVPQRDAARIERGQKVRFRPQDRDEAVVGEVTWISTQVDDQTRTVKVRADVGNEAGRLLANLFGSGEITVREAPDAVAVPHEAVQWEGCCRLVFVRMSEDVFAPRKVKLGARDARYAEVLAGLLPGEVVVTTGAPLLKSEILKSNLGAGCCGQE